MSRIDERLEIMGVDTSEMTTEEKFTAATGLTRYDEEMAANDWYVPAGAANTKDEAEESEETAPVEPTGEPTGTEPTGEEPTGTEPTSEVEPTGEEPTGSGSGSDEPTGEPTSEVEPTGEEPTGEPTGNPSTVDVETDPTGEPTGEEPTGEPTGTEPTGEETGSNPVLDNQKYWYIGINEPTSETIINEDLAQDELSLGWHNISGELSNYSKSNPIFAGNAEHAILIDENYDDVDYCIVLPVGVGIHGAMADPNPGDFTLVGTLELNNVQYNVYNSNGSEFGWMLY